MSNLSKFKLSDVGLCRCAPYFILIFMINIENGGVGGGLIIVSF